MTIDLLLLCDRSVDVLADDPIACQRLTGPQRKWLRVRAPMALWRGPNQYGKSIGQAVDCGLFVRGQHPVQTHPPPVEIAVGSESWTQFDPFLRKLWSFLPRHEVHPKCRYVPGQGIKGFKEPVIPIVAGPGRGSVIYLFTYKQGASRVAGPSWHRAYLDEPPPEEIYGEVRPRLNVHGGWLRISFTPTPESPPLDYLRDRVDVWRTAGEPPTGCAGGVLEHWAPLTEQTCTPQGGRFTLPFMTSSEIEAFKADCLAHERAMRTEGAWEPLVTGRWLTNFLDEASSHGFHMGRGIGPPAETLLAVGIDHGAAAGKQAAVLIAVQQPRGLAPRVWVIDEIVSDGYTKPEDDARALLAMLKRHGLEYDHIDVWVGDRATGRNRFDVSKDNSQLRTYLAQALGRSRNRCKYIDTPRKRSGSVSAGFRLINSIMGRRQSGAQSKLSHWLVHPRCEQSIAAYKAFRGDRRDPHKDVLDAQRYAVERVVKPGAWMGLSVRYA